jgi:hypothetical protein
MVFVLFVNTHAAVPGRSIPDAQVVAQSELVASGTHVEITSTERRLIRPSSK